MQHLREIRGLKYPDEYVIKFFFKENLHQRKGSVLELGCGNGNNLMLFREYGWDCTGIDCSEQAIADANANFKMMTGDGHRASFIEHDLQTGLPGTSGHCDVLLLPSVLYYIPRLAAIKCLKQASGLINPGGLFFLRLRSPRDYRYKRGREVETNGFILESPETGEHGALMVFYEEFEVVEMLRESLGVDAESLRVMRITQDNFQNGTLVRNDDIVLWGKVGNG